MTPKEYVASLTDLYTHGGKFHADDVFAYAALRMMGCTAKLHRVNQLPDNLGETALAFDIGEGKYDHHQENRESRSSGTPYASFGLLVRDFYTLLDLSEAEYKELDRSFIRSLDAADNRYRIQYIQNEKNVTVLSGNVLPSIIKSFNPDWDQDTSESAQKTAFMEAASLAEIILEKQIHQIKQTTKAKALVQDLVDTAEYHCVFMDCSAPVARFLAYSQDVHWICSLSNRGTWTINFVRNGKGKPKAFMPTAFRGKPSEELPSGMLFCSRDGLMASFDSLLSARLFAKKYLSYDRQKDRNAAAATTDEDLTEDVSDDLTEDYIDA